MTPQFLSWSGWVAWYFPAVQCWFIAAVVIGATMAFIAEAL